MLNIIKKNIILVIVFSIHYSCNNKGEFEIINLPPYQATNNEHWNLNNKINSVYFEDINNNGEINVYCAIKNYINKKDYNLKIKSYGLRFNNLFNYKKHACLDKKSKNICPVSKISIHFFEYNSDINENTYYENEEPQMSEKYFKIVKLVRLDFENKILIKEQYLDSIVISKK